MINDRSSAVLSLEEERSGAQSFWSGTHRTVIQMYAIETLELRLMLNLKMFKNISKYFICKRCVHIKHNSMMQVSKD